MNFIFEDLVFLLNPGLRRIKDPPQIKDIKLRFWWGGYGKGEGKFNSPNSITLDPEGLVYIADSFNGRVQVFKFDPETAQYKYLFQLALAEEKKGEISYSGLAYPMDIALDPKGEKAYVLNTAKNRVEVFRISKYQGEYLYGWEIKQQTPRGHVPFPNGITLTPDGKQVFLTNTHNHRIEVYTTKGEFLATWGEKGEKPGQFYYPKGIVITPDGSQVIIADSGNHRLQAFKTQYPYEFLYEVGIKGSGLGRFLQPERMAIHPNGRWLFVADSFEADPRLDLNVQVFDIMKQKFLFGWYSDGLIKGISFSSDGRYVYIVDGARNRVLVYELIYR